MIGLKREISKIIPEGVEILLAWPCGNAVFAYRLFSVTGSRIRSWPLRFVESLKSCSSSASLPGM